MLKKTLILCALTAWIMNTAAQQQPVDLVYPYLDAAHSRWFYFSSACRPFGMVSLFPDNSIKGEWESGYRYSEDTIRDFSHIHEWQLAGVAVMPVSWTKDDLLQILGNYGSPFSHQREKVYPGYHSVFLDRYSINAELTATNRVGIHRYTYSLNSNQGVIFQLGGHLGPSDIPEGGFIKVGKNEIRGYMINAPTMRRPKDAPVFFSAVFNRPIQKVYLLEEGKLQEDISQWNGANGKLLVTFDNLDTSLLMKVGISYTSEEGAAKNRESEAPGWNFDKIRTDASEQWNSMLSRIEIEGGSLLQQRRFYTDLWHAIQGRCIMSDVDGKYSDCTGTERIIRQLPLNSKGIPEFNMYNSDAFWGAQWTLNTLWQLVYPEISAEFCNSFLEYYKNGGLIPRGPSGGNYTFVMTGASSTPFFVAAWQKGIRNFDVKLAYEGLKKNHMPGGIMSKAGYEHKTGKGGGLEYYISKGYIPYPLSDSIYGMHQDGAAITLENSYQDWCLAQLAKTLSKTNDYNYFMNRSMNFKNLYNHELGFMVPKDKNGNWRTPYDPLLYENGFEEANGAQYSWFVPHNLSALFELMGGKDSAVQRLNWQFQQTQQYRFCNEHPELNDEGSLEYPGMKTSGPIRKFVNDKRTWINYSNQPNSEAAFIFNHAGAPWLTQYWSRMVVDSAYSKLSPFYGYNGDEDQGQMGTLAVLMKIGLFQMTGGCEEDPVYELGSPIFDKVTITLNPSYFRAKALVIETKGNSSTSVYIQKTMLNNKTLDSFYFKQSDINKGARLTLYMGPEPVKN
jgi:predicted alpha-1,2-mannosidase